MNQHYCKPGFRFAVVALGVLMCAFPLWADSTLDVQCNDQGGTPQAGVKVSLQHLNSQKVRDKKSDAKGMANFNKLDDGVYRVIARKEGFEPVFHEFIGLKGSAKESVTLQLKPGDMQKQVYFESEALHQKSIELLKQGAGLIGEGKFGEAEKQIRESLDINPTNPDAYYNLAVAYLQQGKWQEGEQSLKRTVEITGVLSAGPQPASYQELGQRAQGIISKLPQLKALADGNKALREKRYDVAVAKFQEALQAEKDADIYHNLAVALGESKKYDEAIEAADQAIKLKPDEKSHLELKNRITERKQTEARNEVLIKAQNTLEQANKKFDAGDYAGALKGYEEILPTVPEKNQPSIWFQVARTQAQLKQPDKAIQAYKRAIEMAPDKPDYRNALAKYYLDEKRYEEALELYADPRGAGSQSPEQALFAMGEKLSNQGNSPVAQLAFEKVLKLNPENAEAYYQLGMIHYYDKKNDKRAKELLTKYLEIGKQKDHLENTKSVLVVLKKRSPKV